MYKSCGPQLLHWVRVWFLLKTEQNENQCHELILRIKLILIIKRTAQESLFRKYK